MKNRQMVFLLVGRIKNSILLQFLRNWIAIYNLVVLRELVRPEPNYVRYLYNSSLLSNNVKRYQKWDIAWKHAFSLWNRGEYLKSVALRTDVMEDIYSFNEVDNSEYFPPFLSNEFSGPFGHNPMIAIHAMARELELLPKGSRFLTSSKKISDRPFIKNLSNYVTVIPHVGPEWSDFPSEWHLVERMQLFRTYESFTDSYPIVEKVFHDMAQLERPPFLELLPDYETLAKAKLLQYGLAENDWFVTVHVRSTGSKFDVREQSILDYLPAIEYILSLGGKVIRIGDPGMPMIDKRPGFIDLSRDIASQSPLHLYALAKAKFFVGTNSGPKMYPPLYGVPSLITNLTSIGLEAFSLNRGTIYIPKTYVKERDKMSFQNILCSHLGFDNFNLTQLNQMGIQVINSSSRDILNGVQEMIKFVFHDEYSRNNHLDLEVEKVRSESPFSTGGLFCTSWLNENAEWFLK